MSRRGALAGNRSLSTIALGLLLVPACAVAPLGAYAHAQASVQQQPAQPLSEGQARHRQGPDQSPSGRQQDRPSLSERATPETAVPQKREEEEDETAAFRHSAMVQKMAHMLGMGTDQAATLFTVLNFLILVAGLGFLAVKLLPKAFRKRGSDIQKGLVEARTATEEAGVRLGAVEARLSRLDDEIAGMRKQASEDAEREDQNLKATLEQETAKIVAAAESEIQAATATARRELQRHAAELAVDQAARRLVISAETDRQLVEGFARRLANGRGGQN